MRTASGAALIAALALSMPGPLYAQSSSPFSGWFSRDDQNGAADGQDGPTVDLDIEIAGDNAPLGRAIRNSSITRGALEEDRATGQDVLAAARADYARILGTLYDKGYYSAVVNITLDGVEAASVAPLEAPDTVSRVAIHVDPGPQFSFARAEIGPLAPGETPPDAYAKGEVAGTGVIKSAALAAVDSWRIAGHAKADIVGQDITADHSTNTVDSAVVVAPGPVVTFGDLHITGQERMKLRRLRKIAGFPSGQRFDPEQIAIMRKRLRRSGVFSAITLTEAEMLNADGSMDVDLAVVEQKPRRIGAGFEISNTDGAQISAYWIHRNLMGGGERLRLDSTVSDLGSDRSGIDQEYKLRLDRPASFHPDITAYLEAGFKKLREENYETDRSSVGFGINYIHSERLTADAAIKYVSSRVTDASGETTYKILAFPGKITWDRRDEPTDAKHGFWLSGDVTPFIGFGDTGSGAQIIGEGRAFRSFGTDDRFTLAGRARLGSVIGPEIGETPRDYLFWSGGGGTVRGQPYESLGASVIPDPNGGTIDTGGMSIATLSAELRWQARARIGLVAFADAGQVWEDSGFQGGHDSHSGAGLGIRYATPIGPLRFDIAGPVSGNTDNGVQLYLGLGQAF